MADHGILEKGNGNVVDRDHLAKEVYGIDVTDSREGSEELVTPSKAATLGRKVRAWINKIGAEERGIERVTEEQRTNQHPFSLFTLWSSANICTATLAFGTIGPGLFYLGWWDSFLCILFFNLIGAIPPALMATLGPQLGLRTMTVQRFSFGTL
jgi:cytosine/uracil/thiamine/allantoin permease